ncbi:unnamed protein product [Urochloa humidicola]
MGVHLTFRFLKIEPSKLEKKLNQTGPLALADRYNFSVLKAKCIEFIAGRSADNLDAVMETEGYYRHPEASSPSVLTELLKAANGRKRRSSNIS